jgi:hypothetical protein
MRVFGAGSRLDGTYQWDVHMKRSCWLCVVVFALAAPSLPAQEKSNPPQWIVVTTPALRDALQPLCERRRSEGMKVIVVLTTDVLSPQQLKDGDAGPLQNHVVELCKKAKGTSYVLLVGAVVPWEPAVSVPPGRGTTERMKGQPSDNAYGSINKDRLPTVAVGRLPASNVEEAKQMVKKTLAFEQDASTGPQRNRCTLILGNPGGNGSKAQKAFAEAFMQSLVKERYGRLAGSPWTMRTVALMDTSPFAVPKNKVREIPERYLQEGQLLSVYMGHSGPWGFSSEGVDYKDEIGYSDWNKKDFPGIFFTCGCYGCNLPKEKGDSGGYGLGAMRNPRGPVAVIGAHGSSHSVAGRFAIDGLIACITRPTPPERLGDYWLGIAREISTGKIDPFTFMLFDYGDGSQGKVPLAVQRREHLEMWMLLGDPALKLPLRLPTIRLESNGPVAAGKVLKVRGSVPADFKGTMVSLTLERPMGSSPVNLQPVPKEADKQAEVILANHEQANSLVLQSRDVPVKAGSFEAELAVPDLLPWPRVVVRAFAATKNQSAVGVLMLQK